MIQRFYTSILRSLRTHQCQCRLASSQIPRQTPASKPFLQDASNLLLLCPFTCVCLSLWQVKRKQWKENLIQTIQDRYEMEPLELPKDLSELKGFELYPFKVRGHFDYANEVYIGPRSDTPSKQKSALGSRLPGVHVITPFKLANRNESILINRGWYRNESFNNEEIRKNGQVHGEQEIVGILRGDQDMSSVVGKFMTNTDKPDKKGDCDVYCVRKLDVLAERCGTAPVFLDGKIEKYSPNEPQPIKLGVELRNEHFTYILTWASLAFITLYLWYMRVKAPLKPTTVDAFLKKSKS